MNAREMTVREAYRAEVAAMPAVAAFIRDHGMVAELRSTGVAGGLAIYAVAVWSAAPEGVVVIGRSWEYVGRTMSDARDWLGY